MVNRATIFATFETWGAFYVTAIHYVNIPVSELPSLAAEVASLPGLAPISRARALAQASNPAALPEDIGLIAAFDGSRCVGFMGLVPFRFFSGQQTTRVHVVSTIMVDDEYRGQGLAKGMMVRAIDLQLDLVLTGFTPEAERFYARKTEWFQAAPPLRFRRVHMFPTSSAIYAMGNRSWVPSWLTRGLHSVNGALGAIGGRSLASLLLGVHREHDFSDFTISEADRIDLRGQAVVSQHPPDQAHFVYDEAALNWMIAQPWVHESPGQPSRYGFSEFRESFRYRIIEAGDRRTGSRVGLVVLLATMKKRVRLMRVLQSVAFSPDFYDLLPDVILRVAHEGAFDAIQCDRFMDQRLARSRLLRLATQNVERRYFIHRSAQNHAFPGDLSRIEWSYPDGDIAFS